MDLVMSDCIQENKQTNLGLSYQLQLNIIYLDERPTPNYCALLPLESFLRVLYWEDEKQECIVYERGGGEQWRSVLGCTSIQSNGQLQSIPHEETKLRDKTITSYCITLIKVTMIYTINSTTVIKTTL